MAQNDDETIEIRLQILSRKRGSVKQRMTYFEKHIDDLSLASQQENFIASDEVIIQLEERISSIKSAMSVFEEVQLEIETFAPDDELQNHYQYREDLEARYYAYTAKGRGLLQSMRSEVSRTDDTASVAGSHHSDVSVAQSQQNTDVSGLGYVGGIKLPTIEIPDFHGKYDTWLEFRDTFQSLIHEHCGLKNIHKYHYLRSSLKGEAKQVIKSLDFSEANYEKAWNLVCKRYNNTRLLINNHIKALFDLEKLNEESSVKLRSFVDSIDKHLCALESLNQPTDKWDILLVHMASLKLDVESNRKWEEHQSGSEPPTLEEFKDFLNKRADFLESLELKQKVKSHSSCQAKSKRTYSRTLLTASRSCALCQGDHSLYNCGDFQALAQKERVDRVKSLRLCLNCLKPGHFLSKCTSKSLCKHCNSKHNTLLHNSGRPKEDKPPENAPVTQEVALWSWSKNQAALLGTVYIIVFDKWNKPHNIRAVLDCGSQSSYITTKLFDVLNLESQPVELDVVGLGLAFSKVSRKCRVKAQSQHSEFNIIVSCLVIPEITGPLPEHTFDDSRLEIPKHLRLADPMFNKSHKVDMLLGADCFWNLLCAAQIKLGTNKPVLQKTRFGWVVSGPLNTNISRSSGKIHCNISCQLHSELNRFWEVEENLSDKRAWSRDEMTCEDLFQKTTSRDEDGRFVVSIPLKAEVSLLGQSRENATHLLHSLERRLQGNCVLKERYIEFMNEYIELGHMSLVDDENKTDQTTYYMPHHGVTREESETTKLRVVFNASAKSSSGYSLNDLQYVGPTIQDDLFSILVRFRQHTYVVSADITKMYRQVLIKEEQRPLQRIVWRSDPSLPVSTFNLNTITYGTSSAPFLAIRCLWQLAEEHQTDHPKASETIKRDFYVDDMLTGADSIETLQKTCEEVTSILASGKFELRKWISNHLEVLQDIDQSKWSTQNVNFLEDDYSKPLGVGWSARTDCLLYQLNISPGDKHVSKRSILSDIAKIFDPLGILAPSIIIEKILLQDLWQLDLSWNEALPLDLYTKWISYRSELRSLNKLQVPRHALIPEACRVELHGFADACERAYGACIYLRSFLSDGTVAVKLLCAKGRVSPLKSLTIPRLELCGALILARLFAKVMNALSITINECSFWSDSTIVLGWLDTAPNKLKPFVSNRVAEIQTITHPHKWSHVSTRDNPADLVSRGVTPSALCDAKLWWSGPTWLSQNESPPYKTTIFEDTLPDMKSQERCLLTATSDNTAHPFDKFSDLTKLERAVAYCLRWLRNRGHTRALRPLQKSELDEASRKLVRWVQHTEFAKEIAQLEGKTRVDPKSNLASLAPFLDSDGTLRVGGRLQNTLYSFDKLHPMVLPAKHDFTKLLFERYHQKLLHCGAQHLLACIRELYWPIGGRSLARKTVRDCIICGKLNPKPFTPMMGILPEARVVPAPPFYKSGVDYAGPLWIASKRGRGCKLQKCYICVFVCLSTKCVHLEAVSDLSTESFLMCLRRFVARRGKPFAIYSDNGTNFVGARNELNELGKMLVDHADSLSQRMISEGLNWHFIPPRAPHFGGLWEAGVRSVKHHLRRVAGNVHLTFEELQTLLTQIESVLNSRPLYPLSSDPHDLTSLTPGHFLIGRPLTALPDVDLTKEKEGRLTHYQRIQQLQQHFWARWSKEYLSELQVRCKWRHPSTEEVKIGALVVLKEDNLPPLKWKMGRVCEVYPGQDGRVRVVSVKTSTGVVRRAVSKVCPLPIPETGDQSVSACSLTQKAQ